MVICLQIGKTYMAKTPPGDFKVTTTENPLLSKQAVTSKWIPVAYTNLQLNLYPNTQLDLFCSDNLSFQCTAPSTWLTNRCADPSTQLQSPTRRLLAAKFFNSSQGVNTFLAYHKSINNFCKIIGWLIIFQIYFKICQFELKILLV